MVPNWTTHHIYRFVLIVCKKSSCNQGKLALFWSHLRPNLANHLTGPQLMGSKSPIPPPGLPAGRFATSLCSISIALSNYMKEKIHSAKWKTVAAKSTFELYLGIEKKYDPEMD